MIFSYIGWKKLYDIEDFLGGWIKPLPIRPFCYIALGDRLQYLSLSYQCNPIPMRCQSIDYRIR